jgi:hypothetical protein
MSLKIYSAKPTTQKSLKKKTLSVTCSNTLCINYISPRDNVREIMSANVRQCPPMSAYCPPMSAYCPLIVRQCPLIVRQYPLIVRQCPLIVRRCPPMSAYCPPMSAYCPLIVRHRHMSITVFQFFPTIRPSVWRISLNFTPAKRKFLNCPSVFQFFPTTRPSIWSISLNFAPTAILPNENP